MPTPSARPASPTRIHLLQVIGNAIVGGMEMSVERLIERLPPERFGVSALCPFESGFTERLRALGADVFITPITEEPSWRSIHLACALVRSRAVDVIQSHLPNAHVLAGIVGSLVDKPVLATVHGRQLSTVDLEVHRAAGTHLAVVCQHSYLHALGIGANPKHLHLLPNGIDTEAFAPGKARIGVLRHRLGVDANAPVVGFVGRLSWEKGPDVFIRVALATRATRPDVRFVLIGDGPMREDIIATVERFGLGASVELVGAQRGMPQLFAEMDVMISTSRSEAMPLAIMEAMASGLPVIACNVGGVADLLQHGVSGWLEAEGDYESIGRRLVQLLADEASLRAAGAAARRRAVEHFELSAHVESTMAVLTQLARPQGELRGLDTVVKRSTRLEGSALPT